MKPANLILAAIALAASSLSQAADKAPSGVASEGVDPAIVATLHRLYPNTHFNHIAPTPIPGITEVTMGPNVAYVDSTGRYFFFGHLFDMQKQQDLTANLLAQANKIDFNALPLKDAIVSVHGKGTRKLAVFLDPDCPYCRALEPQLAKLDDVTIYTFLYPLTGLHPGSMAASTAIWCSKDPGQAMYQYMEKGVQPAAPAAGCATPLNANLALGQKLHVAGTPTMIAQDGRVMVGSAATAAIDAFLDNKTLQAAATPPAPPAAPGSRQ